MIEANPNVPVKFYTVNPDGTLRTIDTQEDFDFIKNQFGTGPRPTNFIVHGLTGKADNPTDWQEKMAKTINKQWGSEGGNAIIVAWDAPLLQDFRLDGPGGGAGSSTGMGAGLSGSTGQSFKFDIYDQSAANTEVVGQKIVDFMTDNSIEPENKALYH